MPFASVIPWASMIVIGYCSPATDPGATSVGGAVSMIESVLRSRLRTQLAFTPQTTSAVVQVLVPMQVAGGPACVVGAPQSASATRIDAAASVTGTLNSSSTLSPV